MSCAAWSVGWGFFLDVFSLIFAVHPHKVFLFLHCYHLMVIMSCLNSNGSNFVSLVHSFQTEMIQ